MGERGKKDRLLCCHNVKQLGDGRHTAVHMYVCSNCNPLTKVMVMMHP